MKQIYRSKVKITLNLKNGKQSIVSDDYLYWPYRYGTLPPSQKIKIPISEFNPYELSRFYPLIKNTGRDKRGDFTYFDYLAGSKRYYHDEIETIVIEEAFEEKDVDNIPIKTLEKDLGFRGYSELLFDRFEDLKEEKEKPIKKYERDLIMKINILKNKTGCSFSICKVALINNNYDIDNAYEWIEKHYY